MVQPGTELTAPLIERLQNLGIGTIWVEGQTPTSGRSAAELMQELDVRFAGHEHNSLMMSLKAIVIRQAGLEPVKKADV